MPFIAMLCRFMSRVVSESFCLALSWLFLAPVRYAAVARGSAVDFLMETVDRRRSVCVRQS